MILTFKRSNYGCIVETLTPGTVIRFFAYKFEEELKNVYTMGVVFK